MDFESLKQNAPSVDKMLTRYEQRADRGLIEKREMARTFKIVNEAIKTVKDRLKDPEFVKALTPEDMAALSNAWHAWGSEKFFPDADQRRELASVLIRNKGNKAKNRALVYARQIWRTEISATLVDLLNKDERSDFKRSEAVEKIMASQIVGSGEDSAAEALMVSMYLDDAITSKSVRTVLAAEMEASSVDDLNALGGLAGLLGDRNVKDFRITVGGELLTIPEKLREKLQLKNVAFRWEEGRIYAQMKNGCQGNLVIIDLDKKEAAPEGVVMGPGGQSQLDNPKGLTTDPGGQSQLDNPKGLTTDPGGQSQLDNPKGLTTVPGQTPDAQKKGQEPHPFGEGGAGDKTIYSSHDRAHLDPSGYQYIEKGGDRLVTEAILANYETLGIEPLIVGLQALPEEKQEAALVDLLQKVGETDPAKAMQILEDLTKGTIDKAYPLVRQQMIEKQKDPEANASTKAFWTLQIGLLDGEHENASAPDLPELFETLASIDVKDLSPDLQPWYEANKKSMEFFTRRSLSVDMVDTAFNVLTSSLDPEDQEDLDDLIKEKTKPEQWKKMLRNEWGSGEMLDTDEEVYVASWHMLELLRLAVVYQYPQDIQAGETIENPIKHYYEAIKKGELTEITLPDTLEGSDVLTSPVGPAKELPPGSTLIFNDYLFDRESECRLFEDYQSGDESLGSNNWTNLYEGSQGAFMGEGAGGKGLIEESDSVLMVPPFEKDYMLGGTEKLYLQKMNAASIGKHYDEVRILAVHALDSKMDGKGPTPQSIDERTELLNDENGESIRAGLRLALKEKGIGNSQIRMLINPDDGRPYRDTEDYIVCQSRAVLSERARVQLQCERLQPLVDKYYGEAWTAGGGDFLQMKADGYSHLEIAALAALVETQGGTNMDFNLSAENTDFTRDIIKTVVEIAVIECATAGLASGGAALLGTARAAGVGTRVLGLTEGAAMVGEAGGAAIRGTRFGQRISEGAQTVRASRAAGALGRLDAASGGRLAVAGRNVAHAAFFVESQHLLNGTTLDPTTARGRRQGVYEIATTAATFYVLGKTQQFMRGETAGARALPQGQGFEFRSPLSTGSRVLGEWNAAGRAEGGLAWAKVNAAEIGTEVLALHQLGNLQVSAGQFTGLLTPQEAAAMKSPDTWRNLVHTGGVVLALRAIGGVKVRTEPPRVEPVRSEPTRTEEPTPATPTPTPETPQPAPATPIAEPPRIEPTRVDEPTRAPDPARTEETPRTENVEPYPQNEMDPEAIARARSEWEARQAEVEARESAARTETVEPYPQNEMDPEAIARARSEWEARQAELEAARTEEPGPAEPARTEEPTAEEIAAQPKAEIESERARLAAESARLDAAARRLEAENPNFGREGAPRSSTGPTPEEGGRSEL